MKKQLTALVLTLVLALALSASAQADKAAATPLVEAYVNSYNRLATLGADRLPIAPIETWSSILGNSEDCIAYVANVELDPPQVFQFYIDDDTSGISRITFSTAFLETFTDSTYITIYCFAAVSGNSLTDDVSDQLPKKMAEAIISYTDTDNIHTTTPISCGALSISFMTFDGSFYTTLEFNPPLTNYPLPLI